MNWVWDRSPYQKVMWTLYWHACMQRTFLYSCNHKSFWPSSSSVSTESSSSSDCKAIWRDVISMSELGVRKGWLHEVEKELLLVMWSNGFVVASFKCIKESGLVGRSEEDEIWKKEINFYWLCVNRLRPQLTWNKKEFSLIKAQFTKLQIPVWFIPS